MSQKNNKNIECPCGSGKAFNHCHGHFSSNKSAISLLTGAVVLLSVVLLIVFWPGSSTKQVTGVGEQALNVESARTTDYASIPGIDADLLPDDEKYRFVSHLNHTACSCDCDMTLAECRNIDPGCIHSKEIVENLFAQASQTQLEPAVSH